MLFDCLSDPARRRAHALARCDPAVSRRAFDGVPQTHPAGAVALALRHPKRPEETKPPAKISAHRSCTGQFSMSNGKSGIDVGGSPSFIAMQMMP
jgi:hypothetical protein